MESWNAASQQTQETIRVDANGVGWRAQYAHLPSLKLLPGYDLVAAYGRNSGMRVDPPLRTR